MVTKSYPPIPSSNPKCTYVTCRICGWAVSDETSPRKALDFGDGTGICETDLDDDRGESK
jgi:hypothetical protein